MPSHLARRGKHESERRRRRYFPLWEELTVVTAHDGRCVYCLAPSEVKDHVIPYKRGGDDDPRNLAPACVACNLAKGDRTPLEFAALSLNPGVWGPGGHPGRGRLRDEMDELRRRYEVWVERIECTQLEILNPRRRSWFQYDLGSTYFNTKTPPTIRVRAAIYRAFYPRHIAQAAATDWTTDHFTFRAFQHRRWGVESEDPNDWKLAWPDPQSG
ncbi:HNH endonuclease [Streptomyces sp. YIM 121038]|uniref:HNH endonuclease n=1 Tax=Streptomyces sp. YIM 121038 TaxID=2136401 RepID=UPI00111090CC|nr:HNH endonuclease [Streptomyces sp. YIM 121038]QCX74928.1 HNH endonuclease [Streptomyces sp. YIM 121038]